MLNKIGFILTTALIIGFQFILSEFAKAELPPGIKSPQIREPLKVLIQSFPGDNVKEWSLSISSRSRREFRARIEAVANPNRLVLDLSGLRFRSNKKISVENDGMITSVRFGVHPDKARIVLDLKEVEPPRYRLEERSGSVRLLFSKHQHDNLDLVLNEITAEKQGKTVLALNVTAIVPEPIAANNNAIQSEHLAQTPPPLPTNTVIPVSTSSISPEPSLTPSSTPSPVAAESPSPTLKSTQVEILSIERVTKASASPAENATPQEEAISPQPETKSADIIVEKSIPSASPSPVPAIETPLIVVPESQQVSRIEFGYLKNNDQPVLRIVCSLSPTYTLSKEGSTRYILEIPRAKLAGDYLTLPQFPPQDFLGVTMIKAEITTGGVKIAILVEEGIVIAPSTNKKEILIRTVTR